eukprot:5156138-Pleurochrysis_carterae.AAC.1
MLDDAAHEVRGASGAGKDGVPQAQRQGRSSEAQCEAREGGAGVAGQKRRGHVRNAQKTTARARQRRRGRENASCEARESRSSRPSSWNEDEHSSLRGAPRQAEGVDGRRRKH